MVRGFAVLVAVVFVAGAVGGWSKRAIAADQWTGSAGSSGVWSQWRYLREALDSASGELELARIRLERAEAVVTYSGRYQIPADLAGTIYDEAVAAGLDPELGFRLVRTESRFDPRATSPVGAVGLAQVRLGTARWYFPEVSLEELYEPTTNLNIGFRYLRHLMDRYGDLQLALLAYNRGPKRVADLMSEGMDPRNGYASSVMDGYSAGM
jgi:soluble lytic murein transglycosylase-like protein